MIDEMRPTKMAVIDVGRLCNTKCTCCYYRYETFDCPDIKCRQTWMKTEQQLRQEVIDASNRGCNRVDFTGGEPTIHPAISKIIEFCRQKNITPRIITNGQASPTKMYELIGAGCNDWLLSIHDIEEELNKIMQKKDAWECMNRTINILKERGCKYATNSVMMQSNHKHLDKIAKWISTSGAYLTNFINCNPRYGGTADQHKDIAAKVSDIKKPLEKAIDILTNHNIWVNVRYYPMCQLEEIYRKHVVNHPQVMFDWRNEWDYGAFPKTTEHYESYGREAFQYKSDKQDGKCGKCAMRNVCGGVNNGYFQTYGEDELIAQNIKSDYPFYYRAVQEECDIVIPAYNLSMNLPLLLNEIIAKTAPPYNIIVLHKKQSAAQNRNYGLNRCNSPFVIMCDDDIHSLPMNWNKKLIDEILYNPSIVVMSARLVNEDGTLGLNSANNFDLSKEFIEVNMVPTACCIFRNPKRFGIKFDERFIASYYEDTAFFWQYREEMRRRGLGDKIFIHNGCRVIHINKETGANPWKEYNRQVFETIVEEEKAKDGESM